MPTAEVGIRELQRNTSALLAEMENEGLRLVVSRHRRAVAVMVPIADAYAWALQNRPLGDDPVDDERSWPVRDGVRISPTAERPVAALPEPVRRPLFTKMRKLRAYDAAGRIAIRVGQRFALVDLAGGREPTLLDVAPRAELRSWFHDPRKDSYGSD
jgi:antitoxin (DNA-binding transcriptional repressor) of toxin-antitoxin stability system